MSGKPYWQVFTGETYSQTVPPMCSSSLTHWRKRLGESRQAPMILRLFCVFILAVFLNRRIVADVVRDVSRSDEWFPGDYVALCPNRMPRPQYATAPFPSNNDINACRTSRDDGCRTPWPCA